MAKIDRPELRAFASRVKIEKEQNATITDNHFKILQTKEDSVPLHKNMVPIVPSNSPRVALKHRKIVLVFGLRAIEKGGRLHRLHCMTGCVDPLCRSYHGQRLQ